MRCIDAWILSRLRRTINNVGRNFTHEFNLHLSVRELREFYYSNFFDFYLECSKLVLKSEGGDNNNNNAALEELVWNILRVCNYHCLVVYHPIMPSLTEELWQNNAGFAMNSSPAGSTSILDASYPDESTFSALKVDHFLPFNL